MNSSMNSSIHSSKRSIVKIELNNLRSEACYVEPIVDDTITSPLRDLRNKTTWKENSIDLRIQTAKAAYVETKQSKNTVYSKTGTIHRCPYLTTIIL